MADRERTQIIYCGLDLKAFGILSRSGRFEIAAVNKIGDFLGHPTLNPADLLFKAVYRLRLSQVSPSAEKALCALYAAVSFLSSALYRKYAGYLRFLCRKNIPVLDFDDPEKVESFAREKNIPFMVVNNWWLLPDRIIGAPARGAVNIHPSRLPRYRGSLPTLWTLKNNDPDTAVSFIRLTGKMDSGGVIAQYPVTVDAGEDAISLEGKIEAVLAAQLEKTLEDYLENKSLPAVQDEALASVTARYFPYMKIDWKNERARDIIDKINLYPYLWPAHRCWVRWRGKKLAFRKARAFSGNPGLKAPGDFCVKGLYLYARALDNVLRVKLFADIAPGPSVALLLERRGKFGEKT